MHERDGEPRELSERAERLLFDVAHKEQASDFELLAEILLDESTASRSSPPATSR